jgi:hypothetical protein
VKTFGLKATFAILATMGFSIWAIPAAQAKCNTNWVMPHAGKMEISQQNGFKVSLLLTQSGATLTGTGSHSNGKVTGDVTEGSINGGAFRVVFKWSNGSVGEYTAAILDNGKLTDGRTFDQKHPGNWSVWTTSLRLLCKSK